MDSPTGRHPTRPAVQALDGRRYDGGTFQLIDQESHVMNVDLAEVELRIIAAALDPSTKKFNPLFYPSPRSKTPCKSPK